MQTFFALVVRFFPEICCPGDPHLGRPEGKMPPVPSVSLPMITNKKGIVFDLCRTMDCIQFCQCADVHGAGV